MLRTVCMANRIILVLISFLCVGPLLAQKQKSSAAKAISSSTTPNGTVYYGNTNEPPRAVEFKEGAVASAEFITNIRTYFNIPAEFSFSETESSTDQLGMQHRFLQQYYKGIAIDGMGYRVHEKNGFVKSANGKSVRSLNIDVQTSLNESQAFQNAVRALNTKDTTRQHGKKLIVSKNFTFTPESFSVAYVFDIDVSLIERWRISIDARTGQVINKVSLVHNCFTEKERKSPPRPYGVGTGLTNYYGTLPIRIEKFDDGSSRLIGQTMNGGQIETYNYNNASVLAWIFGFNVPVYNFYSSTTEYNEPYQKVAVSVQWAAEQSYEYYFKTHNRNSYDNFGSSIRSYVHVDVGLNNAFWSRNTLLFGDGSNNNPLVELDVVAHELTHGVTQYEAQLQYYGESGALNESFSDIFGKAIEFNTFGDTATWQLAKYYRTGGLRDFSNPNLKNQPDTWLGDMWYTGYEDNGGVHYNSGVQNFWYYLLCEGGNGVNDNEEKYTVNAIGMDAASKIAYRNLTEYLSYYSDYLDSRIGSLLATDDLYGKNSTIYEEVNNAWDAVGVIDEPIITGLSLFDITATTVKIKGTLVPRGSTVSYHFEYGPTTAYGSSSPSYQYIDKVEGTLTGLQSQTRYFVRLVATNENGSSYSTTEFTTISLAPLVKIKQTVDVTETTAILYGQINPNSLFTSYYFEYGLTPSLGSVTATYPLSDTTEFVNVSAPIFNLQPQQTYYYRLIATNGFASTASSQLNIFTAVKPVIASVSPLAAAVGSEVIITGDNFNVAPEKNIVNFGAIRATILLGTSTQLKVKVPAGASFGTISLLDVQSGLRAESTQEFVPTFSGDFTKKDLTLRVGISDLFIYQAMVEDMDGDGKPDIVASHYPSFSIYQNVNQGGDITIESFVRNTFTVEFNSVEWLVDLDGNGRKDVIGTYRNGIRVYPNLSVPGFLFFAPPVDMPIGYFFDVLFRDFDQDGHIDIATLQSFTQGQSTINVIRNQNPKGLVLAENFSKQFSVTLPYYPNSFSSADLNNDGKPEVILSAVNHTKVPLLKNESTQPGSFAFTEITLDDLQPARIAKYIANDLNQDGWKDLISYSPYDSTYLKVTENGNDPSVIQLTHHVPLNKYAASQVKAGDMNGDGKVDLIVGFTNRKSVFIKNKNEAHEPFSNASFEEVFDYGMPLNNTNSGTVETQININDLNGDGRPEVIAAHYYNFWPHDGNQLEIWQNAPNDCLNPALVQVQPSNYSATIVLPANTTFDQFQIDYSVVGTPYWYQITSPTFSVQYATSYKLRIRAKCYIGFTDYAYKTFTTDCVNTSSFSLYNINTNSVDVQAIDINSFEIQYSPSGKNEWLTLEYSYSYNSSRINNLLPGTTYDIRFRGRCNFTVEFNYRQFTTLCPKLISISMTNIRFNSATVNWTGSYSGSVILEYSTDLQNWTLIGADRVMSQLQPAQKYFVRGKMACTNLDSDYINTSFTTLCPKVFGLITDSVTPFSARVQWFDESATANYTLLYSLSSGGPETSIQVNSTSYVINGLEPGTNYVVRVAPYCINTKDFTSLTFTTICHTPFDLIASDITYTGSRFSWSDTFSPVPYSLDYSIVGSTAWKTIQSTSKEVTLEGLRPATKYEARVHITCRSVNPWYASVFFETNAYGETSFAPNPTDKSITLYPSKNLIGNTFSIYDNSGKLIVSGQLLDYALDLSLLSPGFYTLKIDGEKPLKIIKQ